MQVYSRCMARTNIDINEVACAAVMRQYGLTTKREAVNLALERLAITPMGDDELEDMQGSGWDGDLEEMRTWSVPEWP